MKSVESSKLQVLILKDQEVENSDNLEETSCRMLEKKAREEELEELKMSRSQRQSSK
jgi:hypothetical protein